jgi:uncharacterized protein (TIGR02117 family)
MLKKSHAMKNFILLIIIILAGCSAKPYIVSYAEEFEGSGQNEVYVVSHGWHTGFVIPAPEIQRVMPELERRFGNTPYIEFGWGDKGFYQAKETTLGLTLRAIFWPTESVVHSVAVPQKVEEYFSNSEVAKLCLNDGELSALIGFISSSFYRDRSGNLLELQKGIYGDSKFYSGVGDFYLMNTCNRWTAKGLKSIGMDISPTLKLTAGSVMNYLTKANTALTIELTRACKNGV